MSFSIYFNRTWWLAFLLFLVSSSLFPVWAFDFKAALTAKHKEGELLVRFRDDTKASRILSAAKASTIRSSKRTKVRHIRLSAGVSVSEALEKFRSNPNVLYAEPNYRVRKLATPNDPLFTNQWNMTQISAPLAWNTYAGPQQRADSLVVAVLDTGVIYTHPDLISNIWINTGEICNNHVDDDGNGIVDDCYGANFGGTRAAGDPWDDDTADCHGTQSAGVIGAVGNNGVGISGVNWSVRLMAVKFLHGPDGEGDLSDALLGVEYAIANGAKIINMSFEVDSYSDSMRDAVVAAEEAGVLIVSASGNSGFDLDAASSYPASFRTTNNIAVAASTINDSLAYYSNYGMHTVDLLAPGGVNTGTPNAILSTVMLDNSVYYRTTSGTSFAAPHVAGAAALVWNRNPDLTAAQVRARIMNGIDPLAGSRSNTITGGRLNLNSVLSNPGLPAIFSIIPYSIPAGGGAISISGVNFGSSVGTLKLGTTPLVVSAWSDTAITAMVPASASNGIVQVNSLGSGFPIKFDFSLSYIIHTDVDPRAVTITAGLNPATTYTKYEWDLGDGSYSQINGVTNTISHTFSSAGSYLVRLRVTDSLGQTSIGSTTITVSGPTSENNGGGGCFIATAAWGSHLHPKVSLLRAARDRYLLNHGPGRLFIKAYYNVSPPIANYIRQHEVLRWATRLALIPLVMVAEYPRNALTAGLICIMVIAGWWVSRPLKNY